MTKEQHFKLVEFDHGIVILDSKDVLQRPDAHPLILASPNILLEYLARYLYARVEQGKTLADAHEIAIKGAKAEDQLMRIPQ